MDAELRELKSQLESANSKDPNALWNTFKDELHRLIEKHIPMKRTKKIQKLPYLTKEIQRLINRRNRKYKQLKKMQRNLEQSSDTHIPS